MSDQIPNAEEQVPSIEEIFSRLQGMPAEQQVPALAAVLQAVIGQMAENDQRMQDYCSKLDDLDKEIHEDFFGPIHKQYQDGMRTKGIGDLKTKYPQFNGMEDALGAFGVSDVWGFLYDKLDELRKGTPDYTDEMGDAAVNDFHKGALDRIGKVTGKEDEPAPEKPATAVEVSVEKAPAGPMKNRFADAKKRGVISGY